MNQIFNAQSASHLPDPVNSGPVTFSDYQPLFDWMSQHGFLSQWHTDFSHAITDGLNSPHWRSFPNIQSISTLLSELIYTDSAMAHRSTQAHLLPHIELNTAAVTIDFKETSLALADKLLLLLQHLKPWRKGPFQLNDIAIDTEWRSDWKWDRIAPHLNDLSGKRILDVGCGNGYYLLRMLGASAELAIGIDPSIRYTLQWKAIKSLLDQAAILSSHPPYQAYVLPFGVDQLPQAMSAFDLCFSMGVLYHRKSPIDHLLRMRDTLKPGGSLVLETLVIEGNENSILVPEKRYAQMPNVWFIPSAKALINWLKRCKFRDTKIINIEPTTTAEQRATDWIDTQSLPDFLDPNDTTKTIEGHPAPLRAIIMATR